MNPRPLPDVIVLNTADIVREFEAYCACAGEQPCFAEEVIHTVMNCLLGTRAEYYLREFCAEVEFGEYLNEENGWIVKENHALSILNFGLALMERLRSYGLLSLQHKGEDAYGYEGRVATMRDVIIKRATYGGIPQK